MAHHQQQQQQQQQQHQAPDHVPPSLNGGSYQQHAMYHHQAPTQAQQMQQFPYAAQGQNYHYMHMQHMQHMQQFTPYAAGGHAPVQGQWYHQTQPQNYQSAAHFSGQGYPQQVYSNNHVMPQEDMQVPRQHPSHQRASHNKCQRRNDSKSKKRSDNRAGWDRVGIPYVKPGSTVQQQQPVHQHQPAHQQHVYSAQGEPPQRNEQQQRQEQNKGQASDSVADNLMNKRRRGDDADVPVGKNNRRNGNNRKGKKAKTLDSGIPLAPRYLAAQKIGTSPEEIRAWREARRKNYPTDANIQQRRAAAQAQSKDAVESQKEADQRQGQEQLQKGDGEAEELTCSEGKPSDSSCSDQHKLGQGTKRPCFRYLKGHCRRSADQCNYLHDEQARTQHRINERKKAERRQYMNATARPKGNPSLLRKLLAGDIRKERAVILQCVHHLLLSKAKQ